MKNTFFTLRVFQGKITYDANGNVTSENQPMKIEHNTRQFDLFLKSARNFYSRIEVLKATDGKNEITIDPVIKKQIEDCVKVAEKPLSADEATIKQLQDRLSALEGGNKEPKKEEATDENQEELEVARAKYLEVFGKKPSHLMTIETINKKLAEKE